ncbi:fucose-1-phosphate guanylyltransferase [Procambarus clarkii]|uniref:fucose-1-phosphate guanylyltransferase n=1 Tax=Procambarus clarkii TaxID=6728 RepID=UPI001E677C8E|nr:fucose-1-phosphate guanylyltransferase-like [Procambarus clarkii]
MENLPSHRIRDSMLAIFKRYNLLRLQRVGSETENCCTEVEKPPFWDVVVLTTYDAAQKRSFERQIDLKKQHGQLPKVPIYVVADPPNQKLGVGGSTLHVLAKLLEEFGDGLYQKKILIIHSGGSSQRLPSYSVLGKIFAPIPVKELSVDSAVPQMLDLKLAMYLPFCELLGPGVFVTCADDIETYYLSEESLDKTSLASADVVALGHPSSISVGKGHGVYVIGKDISQSLRSPNSIQECMEVLQKPSENIMRSKGAVFVREDGCASTEQVWSDSVFWLSGQVYQSLLQWYKKKHPISSELDAYAHFLPCMGTRMVSAKSSDFQDFRSELLPILQGFSLKVLLLNESEFYHMGTMEEYLMHFNVMESFCVELGLMKNTSNSDSRCIFKVTENVQPMYLKSGMIIETYFSNPTIKITLLNCSTQFVIESSQIYLSFTIQDNIIMSNCTLQESTRITLLSDNVNLFGNLLYHTVPIISEGQPMYVTVAFDLTADIKRVSENLSDIHTYGCSLTDVSRILGFKVAEVMPSPSSSVSLWTAKIFLGGSTAAESFWLTHHTINKIKNEKEGEPLQTNITRCRSSQLFSMSDVIIMKDLETLLRDRDHLSSCMKN